MAVNPDQDPLVRLAELEGVGSAMAATRDGIDALLRDRGLRRTTPDLTGESLLRGACASAVLEGSSSTVEQIRSGEGDAVGRSAVRLSSELLALLPTLQAAPLQALARLHTLQGDPVDLALGEIPLGLAGGFLDRRQQCWIQLGQYRIGDVER